MEVQFTVHPSARLVTYKATGTPELDVARQLINDILSQPDYEPGFAVLGDCRGLDRDPDTSLIRAFASEVRARAGDLGPCRWGLVFSTAGGFAAARVCGLLTHGSGIEFVPFLTPSEAAGWVCEDSPEGHYLLSGRWPQKPTAVEQN